MTSPTRQIPWLRIFVEGVVIVGSILLAFGIDAWWDGVQERQQEHEILLGLEVEFDMLAQELERIATTYDSFAIEIEWFLNEAVAARPFPLSRADDALMAALWAGTFDPGEGTRHALVASGRLELVRNEDLRARLAGWQAVLDETRDNEIGMRDFIFGEVVPVVASSGFELGRINSRIRGAIELKRDQEAVSYYLALLGDEQFRSLMQYRYLWLSLSRDEFGGTATEAREILSLIQADLDKAW